MSNVILFRLFSAGRTTSVPSVTYGKISHSNVRLASLRLGAGHVPVADHVPGARIPLKALTGREGRGWQTHGGWEGGRAGGFASPAPVPCQVPAHVRVTTRRARRRHVAVTLSRRRHVAFTTLRVAGVPPSHPPVFPRRSRPSSASCPASHPNPPRAGPSLLRSPPRSPAASLR